MKLVFASNNAHKLSEVRQIFSTCEIFSLHEIGFDDGILEDGNTLQENSLIKAQTIWNYICKNNLHDIDGVFSDDTGLEIEALNGQPGVHTARWAGEERSDVSNRKKALTELHDKNNRRAQFKTVITYIHGGKIQQVEGIVKGTIATQERGEGGFGYDPIFIPEGYNQTFAELPAEVKNNISHRARALEALKQII